MQVRAGHGLGEAANDVRDLLERAKAPPDDADDPVMFKFNTSNMPILFFGITARERRRWRTSSTTIVDAQRVPAWVRQAFGGLERQINVHLDP